MPKLKVKNLENKEVGEIDLSDAVFGVEVKYHLLHEVVRMQRARKRSGTASTKERNEIVGGGSKPYRQTGTGRARQVRRLGEVVERDAGTSQGEGDAVASHAAVVADGGDREDERQRIHRNALVPAEPARREIGDLGVVEAAQHRGDCHGRGEPMGVIAERAGELVEAVGGRRGEAPRNPERRRGDDDEIGRQRQQREERIHRGDRDRRVLSGDGGASLAGRRAGGKSFSRTATPARYHGAMGWWAFGATLFALLLLALAGLLWQEAQDLRRAAAIPVYVLADAAEFVAARLAEPVDRTDVLRVLEAHVVLLGESDAAPAAGSEAAVDVVAARLDDAPDRAVIAAILEADAEYLLSIGAIGAPIEEEA